ncbi:lytic transglycosylase domain-containing protein [Paucibacter sp. TC2R-5]|uniref:lytic transglycosylase domain-containing protein n=1 Tax=Paucibacter sp. TC2R-5 TaxID=2893555 RepID=UPI0021E35C90|nr:lytic transglycosylase domain-containing protein [Paucibacter sp. TC2R-5]MCV2361548.1 lytic transglycosylase domain-containing protein [Paucibacter sp. TC2R-5]
MALALAMGAPARAQTQTTAAAAQTAQPDLVLEAHDAQRRKDRKRLAAINEVAQAQRHPLAPWIAYWELGLRLGEVSQPEVTAFYARWPGSYVEDRLRNDWLLELGRRRDWKNFAIDHPRFQMRDDREVACYALLVEHLNGRNVAEPARAAWIAQREGDDGCQLLASTLLEAKQFSPADVWLKLRLSVEALRPRAAKQAAGLLGKPVELALAELQDNPARFINRKAKGGARTHTELATLALMRVAANDPAQAADLMRGRWEAELPHDLAAWAWAQIGRQAAFKLQPEANEYFERAFKQQAKHKQPQPEWSSETMAWAARAAMRAGDWPQVLQVIGKMSPADQADPTWQFWRARALLASAADGAPGEAIRAEARGLLLATVSPLTFYGRLAGEELGLTLPLPAAPSPLTAAERKQAQAHAGLNSALLLIDLGLRNEGVREWNFSLMRMSDRELRAAAQEACDREIWDRCINTSERSRLEIDMAQRFPTPHRQQLLAKSREVGVDPAYVYGLVRQESRFVMDARSHVGASGLMQVMPATARWTAKKIGAEFRPEYMMDRDFNIKIGASYLKLVLDDFGGSMAMAAAAYNAGPGRPRRWREGSVLEAAVWAENIPFNETRDYVKKVLTNSALYAQVLGLDNASLRKRLGPPIGPRDASPTITPEEQQ